MALQADPRPEQHLTPTEQGPLSGYRANAFAPAQRPSGWWIALELIRTVRSLILLAALALVALLIVNFSTSAGQLGQRLGGAWQQTGHGVAAAGQAVADAFNPTHPPRYSISQDTELASLTTLQVDSSIGDSRDYQFTLGAIRRRDDGSSNPDFAQYAQLNRQYKVPRETKILGLTIRVDRGEQQFILDRGVSFRIGAKLYKVNWISATDQQIALGVYRNPDQFSGQLIFDSD